MSLTAECGFSSEEVLSSRFPLHRACRDGDTGTLSALLRRAGGSRLTHLHTEDSFYGWTPIHWAAHFGKLECVMHLVQVGSGVNAVTTRFAQTPTHIAAFGGHPECLLWLLQAGADIDSQDYVGETPIHKAARAGSMECIKVLLIQGARADVRNASGLTAADLAHAQGFQDCALLLCNVQNQLNEFCPNGAPNGRYPQMQVPALFNGVPHRKRPLDAMGSNGYKRARMDGPDLSMAISRGDGEELESMHTESAMLPSSGGAVVLALPDAQMPSGSVANGFHHRGGEAMMTNGHSPPWPVTPPISCRPSGGSAQADMCGSLHLSDSPSGCVSQRPFNHHEDLGASLHYGHYHGFGDTAEELSSQVEHDTTVKVDQAYRQTVLSTMEVYHGS